MAKLTLDREDVEMLTGALRTAIDIKNQVREKTVKFAGTKELMGPSDFYEIDMLLQQIQSQIRTAYIALGIDSGLKP